MTPEQLYRHKLATEDLEPDPDQAVAVEHLERLYHLLVEQPVAPPRARRPGRSALFGLGRLLGRSAPEPETPPHRSLYLWGGVGRGKTFLVDLFFSQLPFPQKLRLHFHHFMREIHGQLKGLKQVEDPLDQIASDLANRCRVLCLDEFIVSDIGDAMILARVLRGLFRRSVTLVTTSNTEPDNLYLHGLQRASFLPAIDLLKRHTQVLNLDGAIDYRLRYLDQAKVYLTPLGPENEARLHEEFDHLCTDPGERNSSITLYGREIPVRRVAGELIWFDFEVICGPPRSQNDYLEIARCFPTVFISGIPQLTAGDDDTARRFLFLIDEFYDRCVKLLVTADVGLEALYQGKRLAFDFQRTVSRLQEMQSTDYLSRPHRP